MKKTLREQLDESERNYRDTQAGLLALDLEQLQGQYALKRNLEKDIQQRQAAIAETFSALASLLARRLARLPAREIGRELDKEIRATMKGLVLRFANRAHTPPPPPGDSPQQKETDDE